MRLALRWKIILITVITPLSLGFAALVSVHRNVQHHVNSSSIHESLDHSVRVFEGMLAARGRALEEGAEVIARDPRFFSLVALQVAQRGPRFAATVRDVAADFADIAGTEIFEVMDSHGRRMASAGRVSAAADWRKALVDQALSGRAAVGVRLQDGRQYQVSVTPVRSDRRVVGVLLLGSEIGERMARELRGQMRSEVTFVAGGKIITTTLDRAADRSALLARLAHHRLTADPAADGLDRLEVRGGGLTYITVVRPLPGSAPAAAQYYVMQRAKDAETAFLHQMQQDLGMLAMVGVLAALATGLMLSGNITRPIQQLVRAAQQMQRGDYAYPLRVASGDEIGFLADRFREMRQREQVYVSSLEEAARLKSEFISVASHELRTPISVIQGYRDLLASGGLGPIAPTQEQALEAIQGGLKRLTSIAEQATLVAQVQGERLELKVEPQSITTVVERAVESARASAASRAVRVETQVAPGLGLEELDGALISQAITNLVSNGIRFTPDGGLVCVEARERDGCLEIHVTDEGPGVPEERLRQIFDHGYSINDATHHHSSSELAFNSRGLGLGLGITRGIIEAHGGTVTASNRIEGGMRFVVRLSRSRGAGRRAA